MNEIMGPKIVRKAYLLQPSVYWDRRRREETIVK